MGANAWRTGESLDDESGHRAAGLDAKKKSLAASERKEEERIRWQEAMKELDGSRLVFLDECGSNLALPPLSARAPKGQRARDRVPPNRGKNTTLLASLSVQGIEASMIMEGAVNAAAFEAYVQHILVPRLQKGQIVLMDNLRVPKTARVRQLIEEANCQLLFVPAYSPDCSPIEETCSKRKRVPATPESPNARGPARSDCASPPHGDGAGCSWLL